MVHRGFFDLCGTATPAGVPHKRRIGHRGSGRGDASRIVILLWLGCAAIAKLL
jgi:hypothetical protein